ncbi:MAG: Mrp/NBP35 family ATP-binding protein [Actinobacteria bacterium]|nr:Mrp/NBP35 family ATP-binding protein [Actinomycetota bacterium]
MPTAEQVREALAGVQDPDIDKPVTELGLVDHVVVDEGTVRLRYNLTIPGEQQQRQVDAEIRQVLRSLDGVSEVDISWEALSDDRRADLAHRLRAERGQTDDEIIFSKPGNRTKVISIASGKGGVGKSSVTVNLAAALADEGHVVGVLDADIYGYSVPRMLGVSGRPVGMEGLVMPLRAHGCKVISIGFFLPDPDKPVMWRGPMLHRALQQFLSDVYWGDLDFLLCDLPPGTGDIAISLGQMLPTSDLIVVTTPQEAAQKVAIRAGQMAEETGMIVSGVVENMAGFTCPDCGSHHDIFGSGGGEELAAELDTDLLGRVPIDVRLREGGDHGVPLVLSHPEVPAATALRDVAAGIARRARSVVGKQLPITG